MNAIYCTVDAKPISADRAHRGAFTCSQECTTRHRKWRVDHPDYVYGAAGPLPEDQLPHCIICKKRIEQLRAQRQARGGGTQGNGAAPTCSQQCKDAYRKFRLNVLRRQRCPSCNHPSTPEEWASYRQWRIENQGRLKPWRRRTGNPHWEAKAKAFRAILEIALELIGGAVMELDPPERHGETVEPHRARLADDLRILANRIQANIDEQLPESDYAKTNPKKNRKKETAPAHPTGEEEGGAPAN